MYIVGMVHKRNHDDMKREIDRLNSCERAGKKESGNRKGLRGIPCGTKKGSESN